MEFNIRENICFLYKNIIAGSEISFVSENGYYPFSNVRNNFLSSVYKTESKQDQEIIIRFDVGTLPVGFFFFNVNFESTSIVNVYGSSDYNFDNITTVGTMSISNNLDIKTASFMIPTGSNEINWKISFYSIQTDDNYIKIGNLFMPELSFIPAIGYDYRSFESYIDNSIITKTINGKSIIDRGKSREFSLYFPLIRDINEFVSMVNAVGLGESLVIIKKDNFPGTETEEIENTHLATIDVVSFSPIANKTYNCTMKAVVRR